MWACFTFANGTRFIPLKCQLNCHVYHCLIHWRGISTDISKVSILCVIKLPFAHSFLSRLSACRTEQESTVAVVVSVGSAFPRLTTAYSFKSTEGHVETKPLNLMTVAQEHAIIRICCTLAVIYECFKGAFSINHPTVTSPIPKWQLKTTRQCVLGHCQVPHTRRASYIQ